MAANGTQSDFLGHTVDQPVSLALKVEFLTSKLTRYSGQDHLDCGDGQQFDSGGGERDGSGHNQRPDIDSASKRCNAATYTASNEKQKGQRNHVHAKGKTARIQEQAKEAGG